MVQVGSTLYYFPDAALRVRWESSRAHPEAWGARCIGYRAVRAASACGGALGRAIRIRLRHPRRLARLWLLIGPILMVMVFRWGWVGLGLLLWLSLMVSVFVAVE